MNVEDLEGPDATCELCERQVIRYVHHMEHPRYPIPLAVGVICAGHMEEDLIGAQQRERRVKNRAGRRKRWLSRKWRTSAKGNEYLNSDGFNVVVYRRGMVWAVRIANRETGRSKELSKGYTSKERAQLAGFDAVMEVLDMQAERDKR